MKNFINKREYDLSSIEAETAIGLIAMRRHVSIENWQRLFDLVNVNAPENKSQSADLNNKTNDSN